MLRRVKWPRMHTAVAHRLVSGEHCACAMWTALVCAQLQYNLMTVCQWSKTCFSTPVPSQVKSKAKPHDLAMRGLLSQQPNEDTISQ